MRRAGRGAVLFWAVAIGLALVTGAAAAQVSAERVVVTPGEGTLTTRFQFTGSGYPPGRTVSIRVTLPDGSERRFVSEDGAELVWQTRPDGTFSFDLVPRSVPGAIPGHWRVLFCTFAAPTCQLIELDVFP